MIDWNKFAARVPAGTLIRFTWGSNHWLGPLRDEPQGTLIENKPYVSNFETGQTKYGDSGENSIRLCCQIFHTSQWWATSTQPIRIPANEYEYLINGVWMSFDAVMALA